MADRLDVVARRAEAQAAELELGGDPTGAREARQRAHDARRAAALLRAGSEGVADLLAS